MSLPAGSDHDAHLAVLRTRDGGGVGVGGGGGGVRHAARQMALEQTLLLLRVLV